MPVLDIDIDCELILKPALFLMEVRLPLPLVNTVNEYIDNVRESAADFSRTLVGQIGRDPRSAQLQLDLLQKTPAGLADVIATVGDQYIKAQGYRAAVTTNAMWSVHS
jgi:hypothetical protein